MFNRVEQLFIAYTGRPASDTELSIYAQEYATLVDNFNTTGKNFYSTNLATYLLNNSSFKGGTNYGQIVTDMYARLTGADIPMDLYNVLVGRMMDGSWGVDKLAIKMLKGAGLWANENGTYGKPANFAFQGQVSQPALNPAHQAAAQAKVAGANLFTAELDTAAENNALLAAPGAAITWLSGVNAATPATQTSAAAAVAGTVTGGQGANGQTYMLTKDQNIVPGTAGNDTVNGLIDLVAGTAATEVGTSTTFNGFDQINGAAGVNTFKLAVSGAMKGGSPYPVSLANIEKIQVVEINNTATGDTVQVDASAVADLTDLKVTKSTSDIKLTSSDAQNITTAGTAGVITIEGGKNITVTDATTDKAITIGATTGAAGTITVTDTKQGTGAIAVDGGTDVTITATTNATAAVNGGTIKVGLDGTPIAPTGAVTITQNLNSDGVGGDLTGGAISVTGGSTVNVTVNANSTATKAGSNNDITIGTTTVTGDSKTTDVTVTQNASVTTFTTPTVAAVADQTVVTFKAMTAGQTATVNGLTFTASTALDAEQVAAAFANLGTADTQDKGGPTANGIYSGASNTAAFTSGPASGATVTFTAASTVGDVIALGGTAAPTKTSFTAGSGASGGVPTTNTVTLGDVVVNDNATEAIKTITLNGFDDATLGGGGSLDALTTLNLTNSAGNTALTSTSTTLALNVDKITNAGGKTVDLSTTGAVETLTLTTTGTASSFDLVAKDVKSLTIDAGVALTLAAGGNYDDVLETVVVKGAGAVNLGNISAAGVGAGKIKSFSAADNTGGVTVSVSAKTADVHSTFTKYVLSQGNDNVTLVDATVNKAIELGAGDDTITLAAGTTALAANIDGGTGSNTLVMAAADANSTTGASSSTAFEAKISGFDKLSLNQVADDDQDAVNLDNLDDIKYVISAGTADAAQVKTLTLTVDTAIVANNTVSVTINGTTYTTVALSGGESATQVEI